MIWLTKLFEFKQTAKTQIFASLFVSFSRKILLSLYEAFCSLTHHLAMYVFKPMVIHIKEQNFIYWLRICSRLHTGIILTDSQTRVWEFIKWYCPMNHYMLSFYDESLIIFTHVDNYARIWQVSAKIW